MTERELADILERVRMKLYSFAFHRWVKTCTDSEKQVIRDLRTRISVRITKIETLQLKALADRLDEEEPGLEQGIRDLDREIHAVDELRKVADFLDTVVGAIPVA
jgi:hypothetical protein